MDNLLSFKLHLDKKDLKDFAQALFKRVSDLEVENQQLKAKVEHLETLLIQDPNIPTIGVKNE